MPDLIVNTSPLQYLHQAGLIQILPTLARNIIVPGAVVEELEICRSHGVDVPDVARVPWMRIERPVAAAALGIVMDLGRGETEVLALALETPGAVAVIDDGPARRVAEVLGLQLTGTLGLLLDAKKRNLIPAVLPVLDRLESLRFRVSKPTRLAILRLAGEQ